MIRRLLLRMVVRLVARVCGRFRSVGRLGRGLMRVSLVPCSGLLIMVFVLVPLMIRVRLFSSRFGRLLKLRRLVILNWFLIRLTSVVDWFVRLL